MAVCAVHANCYTLLHGRPSIVYRTSSSSRRSDSQIFAEIPILLIPPASHPPLARSLSEYCHNIWYRKTRMVSLPDHETNYVYSFWQNTRTLQTDGQTPRLCIASHGKKDRGFLTSFTRWNIRQQLSIDFHKLLTYIGLATRKVDKMFGWSVSISWNFGSMRTEPLYFIHIR